MEKRIKELNDKNESFDQFFKDYKNKEKESAKLQGIINDYKLKEDDLENKFKSLKEKNEE